MQLQSRQSGHRTIEWSGPVAKFIRLVKVSTPLSAAAPRRFSSLRVRHYLREHLDRVSGFFVCVSVICIDSGCLSSLAVAASASLVLAVPSGSVSVPTYGYYCSTFLGSTHRNWSSTENKYHV